MMGIIYPAKEKVNLLDELETIESLRKGIERQIVSLANGKYEK
jgi:hypothetical protein